MTEQALLRRIEKLRRNLDNAVARGANLGDPEVVAISQMLDQLIAEYLRLTKDRELPNILDRHDEST